MASLTLVKLLFCGQGMTKLIEVYDNGVEKDPADFLALVDCGGNKSDADKALEYIAGKVAARNPPRLDYVVISHQDGDHVKLLSLLGDKLKEIGNTTVGGVFAGGALWQPVNWNTLKHFLQCVDYPEKDVIRGAPGQSHYKGKTKPSELGYLVRHGDVHLRLLISNLVVEGGGDDIVKNASSAAVVVDNGDYAVVLPGDATYQTMGAINDISNLKAVLLPSVVALEMPHHGALRTAVENYTSSGNVDQFGWKIIKGFADTMAPQNVGASAGPWNTHCHPMQEVLEVFWPSDVVTMHSYVSYLFQKQGNEGEGWTTWETFYPVECTVRSIAKTPEKLTRERKRKRNTEEDKFVSGDIVYKLAPRGVLRPEEMVEFRPHRKPGTPGHDTAAFQAPAP
ncbi:MBL fold metallo-hydrolase [Streptomyces sp. NBC_01408]|uniref:MBL fold metallo-hydrolase n=1 Tax=Streptomyces sp. NBC_01408 TaxID=2903855 RepID=UPI00224EF21A|nr:MBL fold metallo-hydrolase [Streptomyces sp. NBC_01408]MCX4695673.1 hypothetical protein [Streptomyces sp. NBC_01408]